MLSGCREYRQQLIEVARGSAGAEERRVLLAHLEVCAPCARAFDDQLALSAALDGLLADPLPEAAAIEARVLAEFDRTAARRASRWWLAAGIAAALCLGVVLVERKRPVVRPQPVISARAPVSVPAARPRPEPPVNRGRHSLSSRPAREASQPFLEIPYTVPVAPEERTTIVRMEIPVAALIAVGFSVPVSDPGASIEADVLVSQDGRARAIRPVVVTR